MCLLTPVNYLTEYRLRWGQPDTLSVLKSTLIEPKWPAESTTTNGGAQAPPYFTADTPKEYISIILNDWPYSSASVYTLTCVPQLTKSFIMH